MITNRAQYNRVQKWVKALESGNFNQTTGTLKERKVSKNKKERVGYCCLGVACELLTKEGLLEESQKDFGEFLFDRGESMDSDDVYGIAHLDTKLIYEVRDLLGINEKDEQYLIYMNDGYDPLYVSRNQPSIRKHTFKEIAQHIREKFLVPYGPVEAK